MSKRSDKFIGGLGDTRELPRVERNATEILGPTAPVKFNHSGEIQLSNVEIKSLYFIPLTMKEKAQCLVHTEFPGSRGFGEYCSGPFSEWFRRMEG